MQRLRRPAPGPKEQVRHIPENPKLERARSSNSNPRPRRGPFRRYWRALLGCGVCVTVVVVLSCIRQPHSNTSSSTTSETKSVSSSPVYPDTCPGEEDWFDLPPDIKIDLHVVARGKSNDLRTTLTSLGRACYPENYRLALHVWALTRDAQEVLPAQDGFVWNHGTYHFHTLTTDHGDVPPLEGWARMWTHPSDNEVRLVLPEGLEVSNLFYFWLSSTLERYMGDGVTVEELEIFRNNVFGISLSATGLSEVSGRPLSWDAYKAADERHPIFHTLPGSRGTAFFGWHWGAFAAFMEARARVLAADSWEDESLLPGSGAMHSWAGSLERFLAEFSHGRGLGILHPNLTGAVSFSRQVLQPGEGEEEEGEEGGGGSAEEDVSTQAEGTSTPTPALRGTEEWPRPPEGLVRTYKDAVYARDKQPAVSSVPAYDLLFQRHPDLTHLRLLAYRFMERLTALPSRNEELEGLWRRPGVPEPQYNETQYLIYQPQFGMGNQLRALEAALAVARVLDRMLVVPDYIADNGEGKPVRYDAIWEFGFLEELLGRDKVILQADFSALLEDEEVIKPPESVYLVDMPIKQLSGNGEYFLRIGWGDLPQVPLPLANSTEAGWSELRLMEDQVLAVSAMFGMFQSWAPTSRRGNQHWHTMVKLHVSEEATWLQDFVKDSINRFRRKATEQMAGKAGGGGVGGEGRGGDGGGGGGRRGRQGGAETQFMCAHIRRQDFEASCARYKEEFESGSAREWVKDALGNGGLCWVEEAHFRSTVDVLLRQAPHDLAVVPRFVFATSDDAHFLEATKSGNAVPVFTLDDVSLPVYLGGGRGGGEINGSLEASASPAGQSITRDEVSAALPAIDVAVCSRAALLMLNYFSTYSALIKAKAKAQPDFVRGLYWADPPALSNWWFQFRAWLRKTFSGS